MANQQVWAEFIERQAVVFRLFNESIKQAVIGMRHFTEGVRLSRYRARAYKAGKQFRSVVNGSIKYRD